MVRDTDLRACRFRIEAKAVAIRGGGRPAPSVSPGMEPPADAPGRHLASPSAARPPAGQGSSSRRSLTLHRRITDSRCTVARQKGADMTARTRLVTVVAAMTLTAGAAAQPAVAQTNGGGASADAPGQETAAARCEAVWSDIQADLRAGGGPKSG